MAEIYRFKEVTMSQQDMYNLVADVENYPEFLPWCNSVVIIEQKHDYIIAELDCDLRGIPIEFTTKNRNICPKRIEIELVKGPFKNLNGLRIAITIGQIETNMLF